MHGVQPNANAMPTRNAPNGPAGFRSTCTRFSLYSQPIRKHAHRVQAEHDDDDARDLREQPQPLAA